MTDPRPRLAYHHTPGTGPTIVFLPGYASDMQGAKVLALEAWARAGGRAFLRFDYGGCGQSEGAFEEQTLAGWRDDVLAMLDQVATGPVVLAGSAERPGGGRIFGQIHERDSRSHSVCDRPQRSVFMLNASTRHPRVRATPAPTAS